MLYAGIDIGSISTETVIIDQDKRIVAMDIRRTGALCKVAIAHSLDAVLKKAKKDFKDIVQLVATGYGRRNVEQRTAEISEISCHAKAAHFLFPGTRTVIDIGGQDSKAIRLDASGEAVDFNMNDKCAAGTGRFLEVMAEALEIEIGELGQLSLQSKKQLTISSMCTVFAESEVVSLLAEGNAAEDIASGLHHAVADRASSLANKVKVADEITLSGGVAKNEGVIEAIKSKFQGFIVNVPQEPQILGALGAALIAHDLVFLR